MLSSLPDLQKERGFPHPSRKKKLLKFKRESTRLWMRYPLKAAYIPKGGTYAPPADLADCKAALALRQPACYLLSA